MAGMYRPRLMGGRRRVVRNIYDPIADPRIIDLENIDINDVASRIPARFRSIDSMRMVYAAGDERGAYFQEPRTEESNIEVFSRGGYNIFCCKPIDGRKYYIENPNIQYLSQNPELNIILIYLEGNIINDYPKLQRMFLNSLEVIDTDDTRFYPNSETVFNMLKPGGNCINVGLFIIIGKAEDLGSRHAVYSTDVYRPSDDGWGEPNFRFTKRTLPFKFEKIDNPGNTIYTVATDMSIIKAVIDTRGGGKRSRRRKTLKKSRRTRLSKL